MNKSKEALVDFFIKIEGLLKKAILFINNNIVYEILHEKPKVRKPMKNFMNLTEEQKKKIVDTALLLVGCPYKFGAEVKSSYTIPQIFKSGIDCSELVEYCFTMAGVTVPDGAQYQFRKSALIDESEACPGDLVFKQKNDIINHVGLMIDKITVIEAEGFYGKVIKRSLSEFKNTKPTASQFAGLRRFFEF